MKTLARSLPPGVQRAIRIARQPGAALERARTIPALKRRAPELPRFDELLRLRRAWGGDGVAEPDYLAAVLQSALSTHGSILECGSGLTTVLLGIFAPGRVWSLEESTLWRKRVTATGRWYKIRGMRVLDAPIRDYGGYRWYAVPAGLPTKFSLVVCDGPVAHRRAELPRYGLMPTLGKALEGAEILLDDTHRESERLTVARWQEEFGVRVRATGDFAVLQA